MVKISIPCTECYIYCVLLSKSINLCITYMIYDMQREDLTSNCYSIHVFKAFKETLNQVRGVENLFKS